MTVALREKAGKALQMQSDFVGHPLGPDSHDGEGQIAGHPGGETIPRLRDEAGSSLLDLL